MIPQTRKRIAFTTARIVHDTADREPKSKDWLWVNPSPAHQFDTEDEAYSLASLANHNGSENGIDVTNYPYFVVRVEQTTKVDLAHKGGT